jgi:hypothetical protein
MQRHIPVLVTVWLVATSDLAYGQETTRGAPGRELAVSGVLMLPQGDWIQPRLSIAGGGGFRALFPVASSLMSAGVDGQVLFYAVSRLGIPPAIREMTSVTMRSHRGR